MKLLLIATAFLPLTLCAQPLNTTNNPNLPGYENPSQQRMQTQMLNQQQQQKKMLNQNLQTQTRLQQQHLEAQINNNSQRVRQVPPGELGQGQQMLPNGNGGMLNQSKNSTPQANIPLKTVTP